MPSRPGSIPGDLRLVCSTAAGDWFLPADGGSGSVLRVAPGVPAGAVRRIRDLGLPGLLPIGNVVEERGQVWLRTPQAPRPTVDDLLCTDHLGADQLGRADAVAVLDTVGHTLLGLHARGLSHGTLEGESILLDQDGKPLLVTVDIVGAEAHHDLSGFAGLAWVLSRTWCVRDEDGAAMLRRCGDLAESTGLAAALSTLPCPDETPALGRVVAARSWSKSVAAVPVPRPASDGLTGDRSPGERVRRHPVRRSVEP